MALYATPYGDAVETQPEYVVLAWTFDRTWVRIEDADPARITDTMLVRATDVGDFVEA